MQHYRSLIDGCGLGLASLLGAGLGSALHPILGMFVTADRPTMVPIYELAVAVGIVIAAIAWKSVTVIWQTAERPNTHRL